MNVPLAGFKGESRNVRGVGHSAFLILILGMIHTYLGLARENRRYDFYLFDRIYETVGKILPKTKGNQSKNV